MRGAGYAGGRRDEGESDAASLQQRLLISVAASAAGPPAWSSKMPPPTRMRTSSTSVNGNRFLSQLVWQPRLDLTPAPLPARC